MRVRLCGAVYAFSVCMLGGVTAHGDDTSCVYIHILLCWHTLSVLWPCSDGIVAFFSGMFTVGLTGLEVLWSVQWYQKRSLFERMARAEQSLIRVRYCAQEENRALKYEITKLRQWIQRMQKEGNLSPSPSVSVSHGSIHTAV